MPHFSDYSLIHLRSKDADEIIAHIDTLEADDRYLRFGFNCSSDQIRKYVTRTFEEDDQQNFWYGICNDNKGGPHLIATLHVATGDDVAEFAFTTDSKYRGQKIGQLLFARGYQLVTEFRITRIFMVCLSKNGPMKHIAKKFGMSVITQGTESEASVNIQYPVPLSRVQEVKMCIIDKSIAL